MIYHKNLSLMNSSFVLLSMALQYCMQRILLDKTLLYYFLQAFIRSGKFQYFCVLSVESSLKRRFVVLIVFIYRKKTKMLAFCKFICSNCVSGDKNK